MQQHHHVYGHLLNVPYSLFQSIKLLSKASGIISGLGVASVATCVQRLVKLAYVV